MNNIQTPQTDAQPPTSGLVRPLRIRELEFWPPVLPAPMCGISDRAWRVLSREQGCPLVYTQMVSSEAMIRGAVKCWRLLDLDPSEAPVCVQLFGADPRTLAATAHMVEERGATIVDLNMGCPADKIVASKGGSALMREPDLVRRIFAAMRAALTVPFTVKFRAGWGKYGEEAFTIAKVAEDEGLDAICIHARTREQKFSGHADWSILRDVKQQVRIPLIGNGDIRSADDAERMIRQTGVDGIMIGRGGMGNPWLFGQVCARLRGLPEPPEPTVEERLATVARHARIMVERKGEHGLVEFRKHAVQYLRGFHEARALKTRLLNITNLDEYLRELE
ncbi:tRNA dihydrouridine synthase DusB, partial [Candidatus Poribacteria bacterium]|nr:tRNA dihydrouridine synthase DusB [Candidatus Poribacteria bacterium]